MHYLNTKQRLDVLYRAFLWFIRPRTVAKIYSDGDGLLWLLADLNAFVLRHDHWLGVDEISLGEYRQKYNRKTIHRLAWRVITER